MQPLVQIGRPGLAPKHKLWQFSVNFPFQAINHVANVIRERLRQQSGCWSATNANLVQPSPIQVVKGVRLANQEKYQKTLVRIILNRVECSARFILSTRNFILSTAWCFSRWFLFCYSLPLFCAFMILLVERTTCTQKHRFSSNWPNIVTVVVVKLVYKEEPERYNPTCYIPAS